MKNPNAGRSSIFAVVGGYLLYMAYGILKDMIDQVPTTMPQAVQILVIVLFTAIGIVLLFFAFKLWKQGRADQDKTPVELEGQESSATSEEDTVHK